MAPQDVVNLRLEGWFYVVENDIAVRRQTHQHAKPLHDFSKRAPPHTPFRIFDSPLLNPDAAEQFPVSLFVPAEQIAYGVPGNLSGRLYGSIQPLPHFGAKPVDPSLVNKILKTGLLTVASVAKIPLRHDNSYRRLNGMLTGDIKQ